MNPQDHWKALPSHGSRAPILVWACALVWAALGSFVAVGNFLDYCVAHGLGQGIMGLVYLVQALRLMPGFLLSAPGTLVLLASIAAALLGAIIYTFRR